MKHLYLKPGDRVRLSNPWAIYQDCGKVLETNRLRKEEEQKAFVHWDDEQRTWMPVSKLERVP